MQAGQSTPTIPAPQPLIKSASLQGHLAMLGFSLLAAGSFVFGHMQAGDIPSTAMMAIRFWIAFGVLSGLACALGQGIGPAMRRAYAFMPIGGLMAVYFITMFEALSLTTAVSTAAVFTLTPLMTAGLAWFIAGQRTGIWTLSALLIGGAGAIWVIFRADFGAVLRFELGRGEAIFLIGVIAHAFYPPLLRRWSRGESPLQSAIGSALGGAVVATIWGMSDLLALESTDMTLSIWGLILYLAIGGTAITFFLMQFAIARLSGAKVMAYTYAIPCWVVLWGLLFQGQTLPGPMWFGIGAAALALVMLLRAE